MSDLSDESGANTIKPDEYLEIIRELVADEIEKNKVIGRIRSKLKRLKDAGANLDAVSLLRKLAKQDPEDRLVMLADLRKYAGWQGVALVKPGVDPEAKQDEMWDEPSAEMREKYKEALIHSDGYNSRMAKGDRGDNPQTAGSSAYQMWDRGWLDCEGDLKAQGETAQAASTERRPRTGKADGTIKDGAEPEKPKRGKKTAATTLADDVDAAEASSGIGSEASAIH